MRLNIKITAQICDGPELAIFVGIIATSDPISLKLAAAERVTRAMLTVTRVVDNVILRHYVGSALVATVPLRLKEADELAMVA